MMNPNTLITRTAELIETEIDGDMVALDVERGTCFGFNATASRIWALIVRPTTVSALVTQLSQEFAVDPSECENDVAVLLDTMQGQRLVRLDGTSA